MKDLIINIEQLYNTPDRSGIKLRGKAQPEHTSIYA